MLPGYRSHGKSSSAQKVPPCYNAAVKLMHWGHALADRPQSHCKRPERQSQCMTQHIVWARPGPDILASDQEIFQNPASSIAFAVYALPRHMYTDTTHHCQPYWQCRKYWITDLREWLQNSLGLCGGYLKYPKGSIVFVTYKGCLHLMQLRRQVSSLAIWLGYAFGAAQSQWLLKCSMENVTKVSFWSRHLADVSSRLQNACPSTCKKLWENIWTEHK